MAGFAMGAGLLLTVAIGARLVGVLAAGALAGFGIEVFTGLWDTVFQAHVAVGGKLAAYDYLASVGLLPFGYALAAPAAALLGEHGVFGLGVASCPPSPRHCSCWRCRACAGSHRPQGASCA